jgi:glutamate dehydrogenase
MEAAGALYRDGIDALRDGLAKDVAGDAALPADIAREVALLPRLAAALDVVLLAHGTGAAIATVAALHRGVGETLGLERVRGLAEGLQLPEHWDRLAVRRLLDDLALAQRNIAARLLKEGGDGPAALAEWRRSHQAQLARMQDFLAALENGALSVGKLMLLSSQIQNLD